MTIGSICSGIEAASVAWGDLGTDFLWFSEIAQFQSRFLETRYPGTPNLGDLTHIPEKIIHGEVPTPDMICGGTPCQAFSVTGHKRGLEDERGQLTLKFIEVIEANDARKNGAPTIVLWENVEGVLKDKTNAFGCFISALAGCDDVLPITKWTDSGLVRGPIRNVAWRVLDAKFFGVPQQRRRLYVIAGGHDFHPENVLFEIHGDAPLGDYADVPLRFEKGGKRFEVFRSYTDCLYSAYGTKWNGNAAAYNGSLYVCENDRLRRLTPMETERLMGFPDDYTNVPFAKRTNRFQGTGNSWAVPVVRWLGRRIFDEGRRSEFNLQRDSFGLLPYSRHTRDSEVYLFSDDLIQIDNKHTLNISSVPENIVPSNIADIIDENAVEELFISPVGCKGILRRSIERGMRMNPRLQEIMKHIVAQMDDTEIERISRIQPRGAYSLSIENGTRSIPTKRRVRSVDRRIEIAMFDFGAESKLEPKSSVV